MCKDPHLTFAYGGGADFRGVPGTLYAFISSPGTAVNVRIQDALYNLRDATVNGTFIEEVHVATRTSEGRWFNLSVVASRLNSNHYAWDFINGTCDKKRFALGPHGRWECDNLGAEIDYSTATIRANGWEIDAMGQPVQRWLRGPKHRIDIGTVFTGTRIDGKRPHGLVGQTFDGSHVPRNGRRDTYPKRGNFTTSAMAEGAIDGEESDYRVLSPYATDFRYSSFDGLSPANMGSRRLQESIQGGVYSQCCQNCITKNWKYCLTPGPSNTVTQHDISYTPYTASGELQYWQNVVWCHNQTNANAQHTHNGVNCSHLVHAHNNNTISYFG